MGPPPPLSCPRSRRFTRETLSLHTPQKLIGDFFRLLGSLVENLGIVLGEG